MSVISTMFLLISRLTAFGLPLVPAFFLVRRWFEPKLHKAAEVAQRQGSHESNFLQEHLASIVQIQLLNQQNNQASAFSHRAKARMHAANRRNMVEVLFGVAWMVTVAVGTVLMLTYGAYEVLAGALTI